MKTPTSILIISVIFSLLGCSSINKIPNTLKENFTYKYSPENKGVDSLISINGYYTQSYITERKIPKAFFSKEYETIVDTSYINYLFFDDGIMIENFFASDGSNDTTDMPFFLSRKAKDTSNNLRLSGFWGTYIIEGNIIKTQTIRPSLSLNDSWTGWESHYKILDERTIKQVYLKPIHQLSWSDKKIYTEQFYQDLIKDEEPIIFIKSDSVPESDCWMKEESWFWKNKKDYHNYLNSKN